ncbi:hypothetical protein FHG87_006812 [Trinorchestia longiramus]|nr:hypothetical protein FHG87_006812 [Trinorchestia longiramus]
MENLYLFQCSEPNHLFNSDIASARTLRQKRSLQPVSEDDGTEPKPKNRFFSLISSLGSDQGGVTPGNSRANTPLGRGRGNRRKSGGTLDKRPGGRRAQDSGEFGGRRGRIGNSNNNGRLSDDRRDAARKRPVLAQDYRSGVEFLPRSSVTRPRNLDSELYDPTAARNTGYGARELYGNGLKKDASYGSHYDKSQNLKANRQEVDYASRVGVVNPDGVFELQVEDGVLTLQLARKLKTKDYRRGQKNELSAELYYTLPESLGPREANRTITLLTVVLIILEPFVCNTPTKCQHLMLLISVNISCSSSVSTSHAPHQCQHLMLLISVNISCSSSVSTSYSSDFLMLVTRRDACDTS